MKIFRTGYEKESFLKSFLLFFVSIEILVIIILFFHYRELSHSAKDSLFLEMKNFSYTFEGEKFKITLEKNSRDKEFYQLYEDERFFYILVPIPFVKEEVFKIYYPKKLFYRQLKVYQEEVIIEFLVSSSITFFISLLFSYISINPLRKSISLIEEVTKDIIHDINTPISGLLINLKILKMKHKEPEIDRMEIAIKQLQLLQENLKALTEGIKIHRENINLKDIVEEELNLYQSIYPYIKVESKLENVEKNVDKIAFKRIVSNLIGNAFKHNIPKNGWVKVFLDNKSLKIENSSKPLKNPEKVFDRYYKESQRGIGLGLSIVKRLCDEMNCNISFKALKNRVKVELKF